MLDADRLLLRHETLLLDMDGTLLDLAFDNCFWGETLPAAYAAAHDLPLAAAQATVRTLIEAERGTLNWYCLNFWSDKLELDVLALKASCAEPIRFLPGAQDFLRRARRAGFRLVLVTNSNRDLLALKDRATSITQYVDVSYSSEQFAAPKESATFWERFTAHENLDAKRCALLDDSASVLRAGQAFGLGAVLGIRHPDTGRDRNALNDFPGVDRVAELLQEVPST